MPQHGCVFISIAGGEAAGKKTVLEGLKSNLLTIGPPLKLKITTLHMTDFMRDLDDKEIAEAKDGKLDLEELGTAKVLKERRNGGGDLIRLCACL